VTLPDPAAQPLLSADEARHALGDPVGRSAWYASIERGEVPGVVRVGRRVLLSTARLREWVGIDANGATNGAHNGDAHAHSNSDSTVDRE
jgi:hypothetical protein